MRRGRPAGAGRTAADGCPSQQQPQSRRRARLTHGTGRAEIITAGPPPAGLYSTPAASWFCAILENGHPRGGGGVRYREVAAGAPTVRDKFGLFCIHGKPSCDVRNIYIYVYSTTGTDAGGGAGHGGCEIGLCGCPLAKAAAKAHPGSRVGALEQTSWPLLSVDGCPRGPASRERWRRLRRGSSRCAAVPPPEATSGRCASFGGGRAATCLAFRLLGRGVVVVADLAAFAPLSRVAGDVPVSAAPQRWGSGQQAEVGEAVTPVRTTPPCHDGIHPGWQQSRRRRPLWRWTVARSRAPAVPAREEGHRYQGTQDYKM